MSAHAHHWFIANIRTLVRLNDKHEHEPVELRAELRCCSCGAAIYDLTMTQLQEEIRADHVRGDSLAQWASIGVLFQ